MEAHMKHNHYRHLLLMMVLSFVAMYILMYSMVDKLANVVPNINQLYMAALMTAPMLIIELTIMGGMYENKKLNSILLAIGVVALVGFFFLIRHQTAVSDKQFLKSMIPHHAGALLMCEKVNLKDPEIKELCRKIMIGQQDEIDQMKAKLNSLKN